MDCLARTPRAAIAAAAFILTMSAPAIAAVVSIPVSRDNSLFEDAPGNSCGVGSLYSGETRFALSRRSVIAFDVASQVPAGSTINSVVVRMNVKQAGGAASATNVYGLYRLSADWGESTSQCFGGTGTIAGIGDATWSHRFYATDLWTSAGGDYAGTPSVAAPIGVLGPVSWPSTAGSVADVQAWLDNPASNFGWILIGEETLPSTAREFDSGESAVNWPTLDVDYTPHPAFALEKENNDTGATATPLGGRDVVGLGSIYPDGDIDYWSFQANVGDRVYAATMTSGSTAAVFDTVLDLVRADTNQVAESDDNDGSLGSTSSSLAGTEIRAAGTYYLRVTAIGFIPQVRPYHLHLRVQPSTTTAEAEPNNTSASANSLPPGGHVRGAHQAAGDVDWFSVALNAGDTVFLSLDADPERNLITWNPRLAFGFFGDAADQVLSVDDANATSPNSEALFTTVSQAGTYFVSVGSASSPGGAAETYTLSVSVRPARPASSVCTTYTSSDVPALVPDGGGSVASTLVIPGRHRILDLDVSIELSHPVMADLDVHLVAPAGNDVGLFTDVGSSAPGGQSLMSLTLDDEAAFPIGAFPVMKSLVVQPELKYRLGWFDGQDAGGTWTLQLWDDTLNGSAGTLTGWSLRVCEPPPTPTCPGTTVTLYSSDFESDDGGFSHSGTADQWGLGLPSGASTPILTCNSGTNCWKTNLNDVYADGATMLLRSPALSLSGLTAPIRASWAQTYQMENASFDAMGVEVHDLFTPNFETLFQWLDASQDDDVGASNLVNIQESAGWGMRSGNLDAFAGSDVQLVFGLVSDGFVGYSGLGIDDVAVTACCTAASCDDGNACTSDVCDAVQGCVHAPLTGNACDDGNPCTANDLCSAGACAGTPVPAPVEVNNSVVLGKSGVSASIGWTDPPGSFNVYRGTRSTGPWSYNHTCFAGPLVAPPSNDGSVPTAGDTYYYLVTRKSACGESIPGRNSANTPIPNPSPCP